MTEAEIEAGTEVQGIHEELYKLKDELIRRVEVLLGLEGGGNPISAFAGLETFESDLATYMDTVETHCLARIVRKATAEGMA